MRKFMKYEIKGTYKFILGIIAIVILASSIIQYNVYKKIDYFNQSSIVSDFLMVVSILFIFGAFLVAFIQIIGYFRKELYEDRGYLTFTLPITGNQILGAKLIVASLWFLLLGVSTVVFNLTLGMILYGGDWLEVAKEFFSMINSGVFSLSFIITLSSITTLILIYLSITLSRVTIKNKKIGGLWFIIFIALNSFTGYIFFKLSELAPYYIDIKSFKTLGFNELQGLQYMNGNINNIMIFGQNYNVYINIVGILSQIIFAIGAFLATGYLIEKKIDL